MTDYPTGPSGRIETTLAGRDLIIERTFRLPIAEVWNSLSAPERVACWYGTMEGEAAAGNTVRITMGAEDGAPSVPMRILECERPRRFLIETDGMGEPWRLQIELGERDGITTVTFRHHLTDDLGGGDVGPGWEFYADRHHAHVNDHAMPDWSTDRYQEQLGGHYSDE